MKKVIKVIPYKICPFCGKQEEKEWVEVSTGHKKFIYLCCQKNNKKDERGTFSIQKYREPVAFGYDKKTGQPLAMDKKGRKFDPSETRYDLKNDRYGWKATDKIPKKRSYFI